MHTTPSLLLGIVGRPLGHSLSPLLHNNALGWEGLDGHYYAWPMEDEQVASCLQAVRTLGVHGLSVTIPHKLAVMKHLDFITQSARDVGAVNTLYWGDASGEPGGLGKGAVLCGENTDVVGFMEPLTQALATAPGSTGIGRATADLSVLICGAGGVARAAVAGAKRMGFAQVVIANRTHDKALALANEFGVQAVAWEERVHAAPAHSSGAWDVVVNATPCGMAGGPLPDASPYPADALTAQITCFDLVYNPLYTPFLRQAKAAGATAITGLEMFIAQAREQFRLWTGHRFDEARARTLLLQALGEGAQ